MYITIDDIPVQVVRKDIRNMHLAVYPPEGRVRVAVPDRVTDESVRLFVLSRMGWIRRQQNKFKQQLRQTPREYLSLESHYLFGKRYRLRLHETEGAARVEIKGPKYIELFLPPGASAKTREQVLQAWYRQQLHAQLPRLIEKWEKRMNLKTGGYHLRRMKTRWGSCNETARTILLNSELAQKPLICLEYILVHEMVHLFERKHNEKFFALMNRYMPQWLSHRDELNRLPLSHTDWTY